MTAQSSRALYDAFLQRSLLAVQQETLPTTNARVITVASPPSRKSHPQTLLVLAGACFGGILFGYLGALVRDQLDRAIRTPAEVQNELGLPCWGLLPNIAHHSVIPQRRRKRVAALYQHAVTHPQSLFAEIIRILKVRFDQMPGKDIRVVGLTSVTPGEGKSVVASNLSLLAAETQAKVLLVDCDLRNRSLSRALAPEAVAGLVQVLDGEEKLTSGLVRLSQIDFLPVTRKPELSQASLVHGAQSFAVHGAQSFADLIKRLRADYDLIVLDLPPMAPIVDVEILAPLVDSIVLIIKWGRLNSDEAQEALRHATSVAKKVDGVLLTQVEYRHLAKYSVANPERFASAYFSNRTFAQPTRGRASISSMASDDHEVSP